ncbi:Retrovirus-related Pol polyprotein from transposon 17.6 [Dictyocoela muelleri]|nr:Retrovirus-related Pol polyprotein from transposon 17.6 [Dictyocoela muelleri]
MPQGFKNSPALFQRGMSIILDNLIDKICLVYIDDILVFSNNEDDHKEHIKIINSRLNEYNLKINNDKSKYFKDSFLGYKISENKIEPVTRRSEAIINYPKPNTKKQLMRF